MSNSSGTIVKVGKREFRVKPSEAAPGTHSVVELVGGNPRPVRDLRTRAAALAAAGVSA